MDSNLAASVIVKNRNNVWIDDKMVSNCHGCRMEFGFLKRKHHCRNCGNIYCYKCSNFFIAIPDFIMDRPDPADYWNISYYISSFRGKEERVCKQCYDLIKEKTTVYERIAHIFDNPVSIDKINELSESCSDIKNHYYDHLRNIQYYLPNHRYNDIDKKILRINAPYFSKHSKYLLHLIKSTNWIATPAMIQREDDILSRTLTPLQKTSRLESSKGLLSTHTLINRSALSVSTIANANNIQLQFIISVINGEKKKTCSELYCTRTCQEYLSCDDCVNILYSCINVLPEQLLTYLFDIIMKTPEQVILCHLPFFISLIKNNNENALLQKLLFKLLSRTLKTTYHTYWFLSNAKDNASLRELHNINSFIGLFDPIQTKTMHREYLFFVGLINHLDNPMKYLVAEFDRCKPISLPYEPEYKLINVDYENIKTKESYTKPVIIPFDISFCSETGEETHAGKINLLFKKESIMNDVTVLNLMTLCDIILSENLNTNFGVVVYPTMPLTSDSGMIEIVNDAETIYSITNKGKTILQHIVERNEDKIVSDVLDRYMYSLVSYTLHSYFIGLGDRHLQNIMITDDGAIFHIDFGFILGTDTYPISASDVKLNADMIDVIGGSDGKRYQMYLELCSKGVILLRKYFNMFFILLSQCNQFKDEKIEKFILSRFQPRQVDSVVIEELLSIIKNSNGAYTDYIKDFLHYHSQEKTVQHGISKVIKTAIGVVRNLGGSY